MLSLPSCQGQDRMVKSKAFDLMLKGLLPKEAPFVSVKAAQKADSVLFLDARSRAEYEVSHLPGARWVGYESFDSSRVDDLPRDRPLIVYCSVGYRSGEIAQKLQQRGFTQVKNLYGGLFEWSNRGYPLVNPQASPTDSVHGYSPTWGVWVKQGTVVYE